MANPKAIEPFLAAMASMLRIPASVSIKAAKPVRQLASASPTVSAGHITVVRDVEGDAALSHRRILHALHDMRRFLGRTDHGHDDTFRQTPARERYGGRRSTAREP